MVVGYRPGFNSVNALLMGYYEGHRLRFAGKVKAGFSAFIDLRTSSPWGACAMMDVGVEERE